jgi:hypothetical protein
MKFLNLALLFFIWTCASIPKAKIDYFKSETHETDLRTQQTIKKVILLRKTSDPKSLKILEEYFELTPNHRNEYFIQLELHPTKNKFFITDNEMNVIGEGSCVKRIWSETSCVMSYTHANQKISSHVYLFDKSIKRSSEIYFQDQLTKKIEEDFKMIGQHEFKQLDQLRRER